MFNIFWGGRGSSSSTCFVTGYWQVIIIWHIFRNIKVPKLSFPQPLFTEAVSNLVLGPDPDWEDTETCLYHCITSSLVHCSASCGGVSEHPDTSPPLAAWESRDVGLYSGREREGGEFVFPPGTARLNTVYPFCVGILELNAKLLKRENISIYSGCQVSLN